MQLIIRLVVTLVIVGAGALAVFGILVALKVPQEIARPAGALLLGSYQSVYKSMSDGKLSFSIGLSPSGIVPRSEFKLPFYVLALAGGLLFAALSEFLSALSAVLFGTIYAAVFARLVMMFFLGRWVGVRCNRFGPFVTFSIPLIGLLIGLAIDWLLTSDDQFRTAMRVDKDLSVLPGLLLQGLLFYGTAAYFGYWIGRRAQFADYVKYLIQKLPKETRDTVTDLIYEEVNSETSRRAGLTTVQTQSSVPHESVIEN